ncbi:RecX family transcriptional regulator [Acidisoma cellulosilytica]|uniref:Regulatory protein RecX n=1 Tax=Acidisoma cellulosilyticum TaxID=2802395 RepID=A0A963Z5H0_9PROT|nr:RecX family transcriptional regulator [Acidisoma cellulosilyticum]MCB8883255.1 RecX family transcriptional regulator [Acidisoma cellulosilyticum]
MTQVKTANLDAASLREAALAYTARYGGTAAALARALDRRIRRWADARLSVENADREGINAQAAILRQQAAKLVAGLAASGAVNDQAFAEGRARRLRRAGRSRRAVLAHLAAKGVDAAQAGAAVPEDDAAELAAALAFARRRRIGPFSATDEDLPPDEQNRVLAAFGRAGFSGATARRILSYERDEAEDLLLAQRQASGG